MEHSSWPCVSANRQIFAHDWCRWWLVVNGGGEQCLPGEHKNCHNTTTAQHDKSFVFEEQQQTHSSQFVDLKWARKKNELEFWWTRRQSNQMTGTGTVTNWKISGHKIQFTPSHPGIAGCKMDRVIFVCAAKAQVWRGNICVFCMCWTHTGNGWNRTVPMCMCDDGRGSGHHPIELNSNLTQAIRL